MGLDNPFLKLEMQPVPYSNLAHSQPKELLVPVSAHFADADAEGTACP